MAAEHQCHALRLVSGNRTESTPRACSLTGFFCKHEATSDLLPCRSESVVGSRKRNAGEGRYSTSLTQ